MVEGVVKGFKVNIGIFIIGVVGFGGGIKEKFVGLVYIVIYINGKIIVKKNIFNGDRRKIRLRVIRDLFNELRI